MEVNFGQVHTQFWYICPTLNKNNCIKYRYRTLNVQLQYYLLCKVYLLPLLYSNGGIINVDTDILISRNLFQQVEWMLLSLMIV